MPSRSRQRACCTAPPSANYCAHRHLSASSRVADGPATSPPPNFAPPASARRQSTLPPSTPPETLSSAGGRPSAPFFRRMSAAHIVASIGVDVNPGLQPVSGLLKNNQHQVRLLWRRPLDTAEPSRAGAGCHPPVSGSTYRRSLFIAATDADPLHFAGSNAPPHLVNPPPLLALGYDCACSCRTQPKTDARRRGRPATSLVNFRSSHMKSAPRNNTCSRPVPRRARGLPRTARVQQSIAKMLVPRMRRPGGVNPERRRRLRRTARRNWARAECACR